MGDMREKLGNFVFDCSKIELLVAFYCLFDDLPEEVREEQFRRCKRAVEIFMSLNPELESIEYRQNPCPPGKVKAIEEALKSYEMI